MGMSKSVKALLAGTAGAIFLSAMALAQPAPPAGGGAPRQAGDWNVSKRSAADKALPNPYLGNQAWYTMPAGRFLGGTSGIDIDPDGKSVWIIERCGGRDMCYDNKVDPIMHFSADGKVLKTFGSLMVAYPHGMYVDKEGNVWVTDLQSNIDPAGRRNRPFPKTGPFPTAGAQVLKFSHDGKLLLRLGTPGVYGNDATHFSQPSDVVVGPDGSIYVDDAHDSEPSNDRIVKFDKNGKFIKSWSNCQPNDPHQLDCGHALAFDSQGRLFNGNRGNNVIDIYDQDGKLLERWKQFGKPSGLFIDKNDTLYVSDSQSSIQEGNEYLKGVHVGSAKTGVVTAFIPDPLGNMGPWSAVSTLEPEGVAVDKDGIIYTSNVTPPGLTKYTANHNFKPVVPTAGGGGN